MPISTKALSFQTEQKPCEVIDLFESTRAVPQRICSFSQSSHMQLLNGLSELMSVHFISPQHLYPFHRVAQQTVDAFLEELRVDNAWHRPLIVETHTMVILDGHHRHQAALQCGLAAVPCLRISYDNPYLETLFNLPEVISDKHILINAALSHRLLENEIVSHRVTTQFINLDIPLEILQKEFYDV